MSAADVLASFTNALIGGAVLISMVLAKRVITREQRQRRFANRRFIQAQRADHESVVRSPVPSSRRLVVHHSTSAGGVKSSAITPTGPSGQLDAA